MRKLRNNLQYFLTDNIYNSDTNERFTIFPKALDGMMEVLLHIADRINQCPDCKEKETVLGKMFREESDKVWRLEDKVKKLRLLLKEKADTLKKI